MENKGTIKIIREVCNEWPTLWDVKLPDGSDGHVKFRYGYINLISKNLYHGEIIGELISDSDDGIISLTEITKWLTKNGYKVEL